MENKKAMAIPIDPFPEHELCAYEQLRENIIQEREKAMIECGFFEDLKNMKKDIGLVETEGKAIKRKFYDPKSSFGQG